MTILLSTGQQLSNLSTISLKSCEIDSASTLSLYIDSFSNVSIQGDSWFICDDSFDLVKTLRFSELQIVHTFRKLNIVYVPTDNTKYEDCTIKIDNIIINATCEIEQIDERLQVLLQNQKQILTDEHIIAMFESNIHDKNIELHNRKIREILMNIFDLTAIHGSYKSLLSTIALFGYDDLLKLKEYWVSNGSFKSTDIGSSVLSSINKSLAGFKKTSQMSLNYKVNKHNGYDDDGLPIYVNVLHDTDMILVKLKALKNVLEKYHLPIQSHIVDIIGEYSSITVIDTLMHLNDLRVDVVNMSNTDKNGKISFNSLSEIEILNHKVLVAPWAFERIGNTDQIQLMENAVNFATCSYTNQYFHIEKIVDEFEDFDVLTKFLSADFGLLEVSTDATVEDYQSISYTIFKLNHQNQIIETHRSPELPFADAVINGRFLIGFRNEGNYSVSFALTNYYGGKFFFGLNSIVKVRYKEMPIKLGTFSERGDYSPFEAWSTFKSDTGINKVPSAVSSLDIMTWNHETNVPRVSIAKLYASDYDMISPYTSINQLNSLKLTNLKDISLKTWANTYLVAFVDVDNRIDITTPHKTYSANVNASGLTREQVITALINELNTQEISKDFTFSCALYCEDPEATFDQAKYYLQIRSINAGYATRMLQIKQHHEMHEATAFSNIDAKLQFAIIDNTAIDDLVINDEVISSVAANDIIDKLQQINDLYVFSNRNTITVYSEKDITISHKAIGKQIDIVRGKHLSKIFTFDKGSDVKIGHPVFACIDNARKTEMYEVKWTCMNALTNEVITEQNALAFRWLFNRRGVYNLHCKFKHFSKQFEYNVLGAFIVV